MITSRLTVAVTLLSGFTAGSAVTWLTGVLTFPMAGPEEAIGLLVLSSQGLSWLVLACSALGLVVGLVRLSLADGLRFQIPVLMGVTGIEVITFGLLTQGVSTIALIGYLMAFALPVALVVVLVQVVRRYPRLRIVVGLAVLAAAAWAAWAGVTRPAALARLADNLATGFASAGPRLIASTGFTLLAAGWVILAVMALRTRPTAARLTDGVVRHRRLFTIIAALGPVPYALARATWLTPWPQFGGPIDQLPPETRLWGLLLGGAAVTGVVLTVGLIRPWGETFPRWMPRLAGRVVPVAAAAVPASLVAAVLCTAAVPMIYGMFSADLSPVERALSLILFPFGVWGPALALAVWGYVGHRRRTTVAGG